MRETFAQAHGRVVTKCAELTGDGIRGQVRFVQHVTASSGATSSPSAPVTPGPSAPPPSTASTASTAPGLTQEHRR